MFSNFKEFISVIQEGLQSTNTLKDRLKEVRKVTNLFNYKVVPKLSKSTINYDAGSDILDKYQKEWSEIHCNTERNAAAAEYADKLIQEIQDIANARLTSSAMFAQQLSSLPALTATVAECIDSIKNLSELIEKVEEELIDYEDYVERKKIEKWKLDHHYHLSLYKEKKMKTLDQIKCELSEANSQKSLEAERKQLAILRTKQENSFAAFQSDMAAYLKMGIVPPVTSRPGPTLEQIEIETDNSDLEKFLDS